MLGDVRKIGRGDPAKDYLSSAALTDHSTSYLLIPREHRPFVPAKRVVAAARAPRYIADRQSCCDMNKRHEPALPNRLRARGAPSTKSNRSRTAKERGPGKPAPSVRAHGVERCRAAEAVHPK